MRVREPGVKNHKARNQENGRQCGRRSVKKEANISQVVLAGTVINGVVLFFVFMGS